MHLAPIITGDPTDRPPLVIAHGLYGSARNWGAIAKRLAADRLVVSVDMRNHGDSPRAEENDYPAMAADLAATLTQLLQPGADQDATRRFREANPHFFDDALFDRHNQAAMEILRRGPPPAAAGLDDPFVTSEPRSFVV